MWDEIRPQVRERMRQTASIASPKAPKDTMTDQPLTSEIKRAYAA